MVAPSAGAVILVPFPFSDLSQAKLRPAVILADAGRGEWELMVSQVGSLKTPWLERIVEAVIDLLRAGILARER